jgi:signal transduction histidine kinase
MRWRIRSQLLLPLLLLLVAVVGLCVWMAAAAARRAREQIEARVRTVAHSLAGGSYPLNPWVLPQVKELSGAEILLAQQGGTRVGTLEAEPEGLPPAEVVEDWEALRLGPPVRVGGRTYLCNGIYLLRPGYVGDSLYILYPESLWRDALWEAVWPFLVLGVSAGVASVGLAVVLARGLSGRIQELERRTRLIAAGDFSPMHLPRRDDEIRDLTRSVNEMAQRLAQFQETAQRTERLRLLGQVSAGLAHQLRNGLTGARLAVQLYARECAAQTDTAALDVALRQLTLLERNLKRFLDLGRGDGGRRERCSLAALAEEAVHLLGPQCRHAGIELRWRPPAGPCPVVGDPGQLGQLLLNVLGNAVEAAGPGGQVEVQLRIADCGLRIEESSSESAIRDPQSAMVVVDILDSGPGPAPEVAEKLFEPFVTGKPEGVGLGLAVARQVAEAHGGRIGWCRRDGRTCFRIELPRAPELAAPRPGG